MSVEATTEATTSLNVAMKDIKRAVRLLRGTHVTLSAEYFLLRLTSESNGTTVELTIPATIELGGEMSMELDALSTTLKKISTKEINIRRASGQIYIDQYFFEEAPTVTSLKTDIAATHVVKNLSDALSSVSHAMKNARDVVESFIYTGVQIGDGSIYATDGYRLAVVQRDFSGPMFILRPADVKTLIGLKAGDTLFGIDGTNVLVAGSNFRILTTLLEGRLPNYRAVIPFEHHETARAVVNAQALANAVKYLQPVKLIVWYNKICLEGANFGGVDAVIKGEAEVSFNSKYLGEALSATSGDVTMIFSGPEKPVVIRKDDYLALVMPLVNNQL